MAKELIDDELWAVIERRRFRYPGRKPLEPRKALPGIGLGF